MELLAIRLSPQAGKSLVIPRKGESSHKNSSQGEDMTIKGMINKTTGFPPTRE
jgi:hypothetical protein